MDLQLLFALVLGITTIVVLVLATRLDAFIALLIAGVVTGVVAGSGFVETIGWITDGFGSTLASVGIVIGLGVFIGKILEVSGAADALARAFLRMFGKGREPWAMASVGSLVSIPVFCGSGYVIMNPLARSIARVKKGAYVTLALALGCGMTLTHHMVPPTPGPLAVTGILGADMGAVILTGLIFTVTLLPVVALTIGVVLAVYVLLPRWTARTKVHAWLAEAAGSAGLILLITGAGGGLGMVLRESGVGDALASAVATTPLPAFFVPFTIATVVRIAQGSGTVVMITAVWAGSIPLLVVLNLVVG